MHGQSVGTAGTHHAGDVVGKGTLEAGPHVHRCGMKAGRDAGQIPQRAVGGDNGVFRKRRHGGESRRSGIGDTIDVEVSLRGGADGDRTQCGCQVDQRPHVHDEVARAAWRRDEQAPHPHDGGIDRRRRHHHERAHRHRGRRGRRVDGIRCGEVEINRQARRYAPGDDQWIIGIEGEGDRVDARSGPGAADGRGGDRLPVDVDPDDRVGVVEGERGGLVGCGRHRRHCEQFGAVGEGCEIDALGRHLRNRVEDGAVGVGQRDRIDPHMVNGKITAGI